MKPLTAVRWLVVHCTDTYADQRVDIEQVRRWHLERGWSDVGYHYLIMRTGYLELGRPETLQGAHVRGHNSASLGIALAGGRGEDGQPEDNFRPIQLVRLRKLLDQLLRRYPLARVVGHNYFDPARGCPCFDWRGWCDAQALPTVEA